MKMNGRSIGGRLWARRAEVKSKSTDESKNPCGFAPGAFKCDLNALIEVLLNIAVVLVIAISVSGF
ncbi:MAG: hypothetical protein A2052_08165 [Deltaproteobacteria bacterium GWA2_54_12]|nr:MAG: hypothetical protein A2052_08165 [Deltaproteobacteria bacterium GWA2_54_12]